MSFQLIAFSGPAGVGKTTAAKYLVQRHGFTRMSFADPLRDMLRVLGLDDNHFGPLKELPCDLLEGKTPRKALQSLGTEWGRAMIGAEIWKNAALRRIYEAIQDGKRVVIDDCRFDNEADAILRSCGVVVELTRPGVERKAGHASEAGLSHEMISFYLDAATVEELQVRLDDMIAVQIVRT